MFANLVRLNAEFTLGHNTTGILPCTSVLKIHSVESGRTAVLRLGRMLNDRDLPSKDTDSPKDEDRVLEFKPGDISQLTKNIESRLRSVSKPNASRKPRNKRDAKDNAVNQRNVASKQRPSSNEGSQKARASREENRLPADKLDSSTKEQRGKKRSQDGRVKATVFPISNAITDDSQINGRVKDMVDRSLIEQEVLALGGTKEDYKLVEDDDSTTDIEFGDPGRQNNKGLKKDLVRFVKELGIDQVGQEPDQSSEIFEGDRTIDVPTGLINTLKLKNEKKGVSRLVWIFCVANAIPPTDGNSSILSHYRSGTALNYQLYHLYLQLPTRLRYHQGYLTRYINMLPYFWILKTRNINFKMGLKIRLNNSTLR